jgi:hypothetical protein
MNIIQLTQESQWQRDKKVYLIQPNTAIRIVPFAMLISKSWLTARLKAIIYGNNEI